MSIDNHIMVTMNENDNVNDENIDEIECCADNKLKKLSVLVVATILRY